MKAELAISLLRQIYCNVLVDELHKLALSTDSKVDDTLIGVMDALMQCPKASTQAS